MPHGGRQKRERRGLDSATLRLMAPALSAFMVIFLLGVLLRSTALLGKSHAEKLASLVFAVSLPATIIVSLDRLPFAVTAWKLPLAACLVTLPLVFCAWQVARRLDVSRPTQGGLLLGTGCINSVYFAYPVSLATFGEAGLAQAILFDLGQTLLTLTVLYGLAVWYGAHTSTPRSAMMRLVSSPPLWALSGILLLKLLGLKLPAWLHDGLMPIHMTTTPLASLVLGLSISFAAVRRTARLALLGVGMRMVGGLFFGSIAVWLLQLTGVERAIVLLISAMPSAVTAVIFAAEAGLDEDLVASIVALSICLGVALVPALPALAVALMP
jgi:malate permease and related proteins